MARTDFEISGLGPLDYRLEFEGLDYQFVTNLAMEKTTTVSTTKILRRRLGLQRDGLQIKEKAYPLQSDLSVQGMTFTIGDFAGEGTAAFFRKPSKSTYITQNVHSSSADIYVADSSGWAAGNLAFIGTETVRITSVVEGRLIGLRGQLNSVAQSHFVTTNFGVPVLPLVTDVPLSVERRRINLYEYGRFDDKQGDGRLVWKGIAISDVKSNGGLFTVVADPITSLLDAEIGLGLGKLGVRGIYHPTIAPWTVQAHLSSDNFVGSSATDTTTIRVSGAFSDVYEMVAEMNTKLETATAGWASQCGAKVYNGRIVLTFTTDGTNKAVQFHSFGFNEYPDGRTQNSWLHETTWFGPADTHDTNTTLLFRDMSDEPDELEPFVHVPNGETAIGFQYAALMATLDPYPAGVCAYIPRDPEGVLAAAAVANGATAPFQFPANRIYLNTPTFPAAIDAIKIIPPPESPLAAYGEFTFAVDSVDSTNRYVVPKPDPSPFNFLLIDEIPEIEIGASFGLETDIAGFLRAVTTYAPASGNNGSFPNLTTNDIDLEDIELQLSSSLITPFNSKRNYLFFKKSRKLFDYVSEEAKLRGMFLCLGPSGSITLRPLRFASSTEPIAIQITAAGSTGFPAIEKNREGLYNSITLKTSYNAREDKHVGPEFQLNHLGGIGLLNGKKREVAITPYSEATVAIREDEINSVLVRPLYFFALPYYVITVRVPAKYSYARLGDTVSLTSPTLPNSSTGRRGVTGITGRIIDRSFDLARGEGSISFYYSDINWAGYSPTCKTVSKQQEAFTPDNQPAVNLWSCVISASLYAPPLSNDSDFFSVGDKVLVVEEDANSPTSGSAFVYSKPSATTMWLSFSAAPPLPFHTSSTVFNIEFANSGTVGTNQLAYCYLVSGSYSGSNANARVFGV